MSNLTISGGLRWVSILTGLERPVQHSGGLLRRAAQHVSILTGLERPVQQDYVVMATGAILFQSSPALNGRCNCKYP